MGVGLLRTSDDVGAPVLTTTSGSLVGLLKAVLVDGYGTYAGLGWTNPFINVGGTVAVFQNNSVTGTGTFVRVDNNLADARRANVQAYENMTTIDDGLLPVHNLSAPQYIYTHYLAGGGVTIPWKIIGDDKGFWLATHYHYLQSLWYYTQKWGCFYIGDYVPKSIDNKWNFVLYAAQNISFEAIEFAHMLWLSTPPTVNSYNYLRVARDNSYEPGSVSAGLASACPNQPEYMGYASRLSLLADSIQYSAPVYIHTSTGTIGRFPGFRDSCSRFGIDGVAVTESTAPTKCAKVFDYGDYKEFFFPIGASSWIYNPVYVIIISGRGFRNGLM